MRNKSLAIFTILSSSGHPVSLFGRSIPQLGSQHQEATHFTPDAKGNWKNYISCGFLCPDCHTVSQCEEERSEGGKNFPSLSSRMPLLLLHQQVKGCTCSLRGTGKVAKMSGKGQFFSHWSEQNPSWMKIWELIKLAYLNFVMGFNKPLAWFLSPCGISSIPNSFEIYM